MTRLNSIIAVVLADRRKRYASVTQADMAGWLGLTQGTISRIERGEIAVSVETFIRWCDRLEALSSSNLPEEVLREVVTDDLSLPLECVTVAQVRAVRTLRDTERTRA